MGLVDHLDGDHKALACFPIDVRTAATKHRASWAMRSADSPRDIRPVRLEDSA